MSANEKVQSVLESKDRTQNGKETTLRQALSRTEGRNRQAGNRARRRCYSQVIRDCWAMGVVNLTDVPILEN